MRRLGGTVCQPDLYRGLHNVLLTRGRPCAHRIRLHVLHGAILQSPPVIGEWRRFFALFDECKWEECKIVRRVLLV